MPDTLDEQGEHGRRYSHPHKADTLAGETENNGHKLEISDRMLCYEEN